MKKNTRTSGITLLMGVLSVFFLATTVGTYLFMSNSLAESAENSKLLTYQIEELRKTNDQLKTQVTELEATQEELTDYKDAIGTYFELSDSINEDLDSLTETFMSFSKDTSTASSNAKVNTFASQLETLKEHGSEWQEVLTAHREDFEAIGIDVDAELAQMTATIPKVEQSLTDMQAHMAA